MSGTAEPKTANQKKKEALRSPSLVGLPDLSIWNSSFFWEPSGTGTLYVLL